MSDLMVVTVVIAIVVFVIGRKLIGEPLWGRAGRRAARGPGDNRDRLAGQEQQPCSRGRCDLPGDRRCDRLRRWCHARPDAAAECSRGCAVGKDARTRPVAVGATGRRSPGHGPRRGWHRRPPWSACPPRPGAACRVAAAVASGAGTRVARAGTASGLNDVLLAAAAFAALGAVAGFAYGPGPVRQPPPKPGAEPVAPAEHVQRAADPGSAAG